MKDMRESVPVKTTHAILFRLVFLFLFPAIGFLHAGAFTPTDASHDSKGKRVKADTLTRTANPDSLFKIAFLRAKYSFAMPADAKVESYRINPATREVNISCNDHFGAQPFRENTVQEMKDTVEKFFRSPGYHISISTLGHEITELIPNVFRSASSFRDGNRIYQNREPLQVITNLSRPYKVSVGLQNRNIVLWPSHGWYYNHKTERWEWQRPRLFQTVEDLLPYSIVIPFLAPMLENAGANIYIPRERDVQLHEVIVDNDSPEDNRQHRYFETGDTALFTTDNPGFAMKAPELEDRENPFREGTARAITTARKESASVQWTPEFPASGDYAVSVAYNAKAANATDARYRVYHSGGFTDFAVNQQVGGSTWYYLGTFHFRKGCNANTGSVRLSNASATGSYVSADAVRFGGGMGVVKKGGAVSGRPKFTEGARYWLQFAGMPDSLVYAFNKDDDYKDDFQSRGEYVNYLHGTPFGPMKDRTAGLHIPIDLSLAFHTDAGTAAGDSTVGTLAIYSLKDIDGKPCFPNTVSRMANRDLADIIQTQIADDIREQFDSTWSRRELRNADYSESGRPQVPSLILELLAHQNFADMRYSQTPEFRFAVARSVYKGILKYLADTYHYVYKVQPLPPVHFSVLPGASDNAVLQWKPKEDPLEPTAHPTAYVLYTAMNDGGFDNGVLVKEPVYTVNDLRHGSIYRFKVTAVNEGGESFPSEELAFGLADKPRGTVLIVNGFHRTSAPDWVSTPTFTGFTANTDEGVAYGKDVSLTGWQTDFAPESPYISNDAPGFGSSAADKEGQVIAGNTFNYPYIHGKAIFASGYSFCSQSDAAFMTDSIAAGNRKIIDLIYGEEKTSRAPQPGRGRDTRHSVFPPGLRAKLRTYLADGSALFLSGAFIATDPFRQKTTDSSAYDFIRDQLHFGFNSDHASKNGLAVPVKSTSRFTLPALEFSVSSNDSIYRVDSPGGLLPGKGANVILRYEENEFPAAIMYKDKYAVIAMGFPFETILGEQKRNAAMREILLFLTAGSAKAK
jgi:hypothetical protein